MRLLAVAVFVFSACGSSRKPPPPIASTGDPAPTPPPFKCDDYAIIIGEAGHTPAGPDDSAEVQVFTACGCPYTVTTTGDMALRVKETYEQWHATGCGPINCDEPCPR